LAIQTPQPAHFHILGFGWPVCTRAQFDAVEGYDEVFTGWGGDDWDFCLRLKEAGYALRVFPHSLLEDQIPNSDEQRTAYYDIKDTKASVVRARYYIAAKRKLKAIKGHCNIPLAIREALFKQTVAILDYQRFKQSEQTINFVCDGVSFSVTREDANRLKREMKRERRVPFWRWLTS
jgi:hypothetical protein